jgi:hypothetical protein
MVHVEEKFSNFSYLITEKKIDISNKMKSVLESIRVKSYVARNLLSILEQTDDWDPSKIGFDYLDLEEDDNEIFVVTYTPLNILKKYSGDNDVDFYDSDKRLKAKVGKFAKNVLEKFGVIIRDVEYENFVNLIKSKGEVKSAKFMLVSGPDIKKYYSRSSYKFESIGQLGKSCMARDECQSFFGIYVDNPDVCQMLIYVDSDGKLLGRALVWKMDHCQHAQYFMDRVYAYNNPTAIKFIDYANSNNWMVKYFNSVSDFQENVIFKKGNKVILDLITVKLKNTSFSKYPFMDTLTYLNKSKGTLSNVNSEGSLILSDTEGRYSNSSTKIPTIKIFHYTLVCLWEDIKYTDIMGELEDSIKKTKKLLV